MRDIDFEELDKAVGSYLKNGVVPNTQSKSNFAGTVNRSENSLDYKEMVFARKAPRSADQLHQNTEEKRNETSKNNIRNVDIQSAKVEKKSVAKKTKVRILDDFSAPVPPEHHRDNFGVPFSQKEDKIAFESPVLETYGGEKPVRNIKRMENSPIRKRSIVRLEKRSERKEIKPLQEEQLKKQQITNIEEKSAVIPDRAKFYAGVYNIGEDDNNLRFFHGDRAIEVPERKNIKPTINTPKIETEPTFEKVMPEIGSDHNQEDDIIPIHKEDDVKDLSESKNRIIFEDKKDIEEKDQINKLDANKEETDQLVKKSENHDKVIIQTVDKNIDQPKTPFVQNPQIEKRPLGMRQSQGQQKSFEFKKITLNQSQKPTIVKELKQAKSTTPILASDEYSAPIKRRKKSGWGIVIAIIAIMIFGAAAGFAAYWFTFQ